MQIAQVHRATLLNGQEVVVKVQHDGIKAIILEVTLIWLCTCGEKNSLALLYVTHCSTLLQDLKNAKSIVDWIAWAEPEYNFSPMIDEWCKEAPKELDFNREAGMLSSNSISH